MNGLSHFTLSTLGPNRVLVDKLPFIKKSLLPLNNQPCSIEYWKITAEKTKYESGFSEAMQQILYLNV